MSREAIRADGVPLTPAEKSKRYREKQRKILAHAKRIVADAENQHIHRIEFRPDDNTFHINDSDDSFWYSTTDYLLWYLKLLDNNVSIVGMSNETKQQQTRAVIAALSKSGLRL